MKLLTIERGIRNIRRVLGGLHMLTLYTLINYNNVGSFDFASSYPAIMINEKFPMTKGEK